VSAPAPRVSLVLPAYGEAENLGLLLPRLLAMEAQLGALEIVVVDDHSDDGTFDVVRTLSATDPRVRGRRLARNSGSHMAILCGLQAARGESAIVMAADGQDPPEVLGQLVDEWSRGAHVVWAARERNTGESLPARLLSRLYWTTMNRLSSVQLPTEGTDCFLIDRRPIEALLAIPEQHTSVVALIYSLGFRQTVVRYRKQARARGRSKWTFRKKVRLVIDSLVGFSTVPLRLASALGFAYAAGGFLYAFLLVLNKVTGGRVFGSMPPFGWAALMVMMVISSGTIMMILGIFGEYLWRALEQVRGRPRFLIEDEV
jgi:glycosyltransferase involved in cell wall biosynthesis